MEQFKELFIKGTSKTPEVNFKRGFIRISGRSIPEDSVTFFQPLVNWIEKYITNPEEITRVDLKIEYINSGSNRFIFNILRLLDESYKQGNKVVISWLYEEDDETIKNLGQDFKALIEVPINLVIITT